MGGLATPLGVVGFRGLGFENEKAMEMANCREEGSRWRLVKWWINIGCI
jgi:hypothetical protein